MLYKYIFICKLGTQGRKFQVAIIIDTKHNTLYDVWFWKSRKIFKELANGFITYKDMYK